uniref:Uncharacterized protein n=1 Tax=Haptolina brevifila TaxID=156173 RepID=A0A7S2FH02_9EUKA
MEILDVRGNALHMLPPALGSLSKLRKLELARNKLTALPSSMKDSPESLQVDCAGNTGLVSPPFALAKQGIQAIRRYFASDAREVERLSAPRAEEVAMPSVEHRKQMTAQRGRPPQKLEGASSRHNWTRASEWLLLV